VGRNAILEEAPCSLFAARDFAVEDYIGDKARVSWYVLARDNCCIRDRRTSP
jgi:hypothetical protein